MLSSALSVPMDSNVSRTKSQLNTGFRSKSQLVAENRFGFISPTNPMKNFFENLLHLTPHRYITTTTTIVGNHSKAPSNLSVNFSTDRSSRLRNQPASIISSFSLHSNNEHSPYENRPLPTELTLKFRRAGNLILFAIYWCNLARKQNQLRSMVYQSYLQTSDPVEKYMFDKSNFKIQSIEILSFVKDFFQQRTGERNIENISEIRKSLNDIKPFTRLPKELQDRLLQKASYECYPERRTVVRQGERPACFYIILSGSAIPTYKRATDGNIETLNVLQRGCTFGEKGLMTDSTQNFTVTSKTKLELLVLWKDDFKSIYMTKNRYCSKDDLRFLKTGVSFLRDFPIERLNEIPNGIQHCHFKQSELVAKDSRRIQHLFVVKKGSLDVWKRLEPDGFDHERNQNHSKSISEENSIDADEATGDNRTLFSEIQLSGDVNESKSNTNAIDADFRLSRLRCSPLDNQRASSALSTASRSVVNTSKKFPGIVDKRDRIQLIDYDSLSINNNKTKLTSESERSKRSRSQTQYIPKKKLIHPDKMIYVHVKTLNEGQYFGLTDLLFPNQPSLTLVSNDCECLLLNKSLFMRFASDQYKQSLRRSEIPFPNDDLFYKTFHANEIWKRFSKQTYIDAFERINRKPTQNIKRSSKINKEQPILIGTS